MIGIKGDWHPIFQFLYDLSQGQPGINIRKSLRKNLLIEINSFLDEEENPRIYVSVRRDSQTGKRSRSGTSIEEGFWFYYKDGSFATDDNVEFTSLLGWGKKSVKGKSDPHSPVDYNSRFWTWGRRQLDRLQNIIEHSERVNPYTGELISP